MINKVAPKFNSNPGQYLDSCKLPKSSTGDCIYTTDSEFYFIDGENCRNSRDFSEFYHHQDRSNNVKNLHESGPVVIDPVYEIIPEVLSEADELYCLPQDSRHVNISVSNNSNKLDNNKFRPKPMSGDKIRSICRSISSPMRMNEQADGGSKVKRSASSYKQQQQPADLSSNIVYTNINNLERTMRDQQERLLSQFHNHQLQSKPPQFVAPPPPQHPPPSSSNDKNEKPSSFPAAGDQHWQWRIKVNWAKNQLKESKSDIRPGILWYLVTSLISIKILLL